MARDLLVSVPEEEPRIIVATSHFESLADMTFQREEQLTVAFAQMAKYEDAIIMGDTNILQIDGKVWLCSRQVNVPQPWIDVWPTIRPDDPGWTRDPSNPNCPSRKDPTRLDRCLPLTSRIFLKSSQWTPLAIELVGNTEDPEFPGLRPSDHYGLFCLFHRTDSPPTPPVQAASDLPLFERPPNWQDFLG